MRFLPVESAVADGRTLDPIERTSEVLFGLIMVLTFTGSLSVAEAGRDDVRAMLVGALGCNFAWGVIDAIFYLMGRMAEKGTALLTLLALRRSQDPERARSMIVEALPAPVAEVLEPSELESIRLRLNQLPEPPRQARLEKKDWLGALGVFLLVFLSTFPVAVPFLVMSETLPAMRVSNGIAIVLLFLTGFAFGRMSGRNPWGIGLAMVVFGALLVAMTIALGG